MRLRLPLLLSAASISVEPRRSGLAFTADIQVPALPMPRVSSTLVLGWNEFAIITTLFLLAEMVVHLRDQIAATWLVAQWGPANQTTAAGLVTLIAFLLGWAIALWKKRQLFTYSISEMIFALFSIFQIAWSLWPTGELSRFVGLGSALYLMSRGAGNLWDAFVLKAEHDQVTVRLE
jgi:hypothetical protein